MIKRESERRVEGRERGGVGGGGGGRCRESGDLHITNGLVVDSIISNPHRPGTLTHSQPDDALTTRYPQVSNRPTMMAQRVTSLPQGCDRHNSDAYTHSGVRRPAAAPITMCDFTDVSFSWNVTALSAHSPPYWIAAINRDDTLFNLPIKHSF